MMQNIGYVYIKPYKASKYEALNNIRYVCGGKMDDLRGDWRKR